MTDNRATAHAWIGLVKTDVERQASEYIANSRDWVAGIDRSVLGVQAVDAEVLALTDAMDIAAEDNSSSSSVAKELTSQLTSYLMTSGIDPDIWDALSELVLWRKHYGHYNDSFAVDYADDDVMARAAFLEDVLSITSTNHAAIPYTDVGIMDVDVIADFIANDIDPELAASTLNDAR